MTVPHRRFPSVSQPTLKLLWDVRDVEFLQVTDDPVQLRSSGGVGSQFRRGFLNHLGRFGRLGILEGLLSPRV